MSDTPGVSRTRRSRRCTADAPTRPGSSSRTCASVAAPAGRSRAGRGFKQVMGVLNDMRVAEGARCLAAAELAFGADRRVRQGSARVRPAHRRLPEHAVPAGGDQDRAGRLARIPRPDAAEDQARHADPGRCVDGEDVAVGARAFASRTSACSCMAAWVTRHESPISSIWTHARVHRILLGRPRFTAS